MKLGDKIATFIIEDNSSSDKKHSEYLSYININVNGKIIDKVIQVLQWSIENNEKAILLSNNLPNLETISFEELNSTLPTLVEDNIFCVLLDVSSEHILPITNHLALVEKIFFVNSCMITQPLFEILLENLLDIKNDTHEITFTSIVEGICPHKLLWAETSQTIIENKINIIAPYRNCALFIEQTIETVLKQDYKNFQIYFIDDESTDDSFSLIPDKHSKIIKTKNEKRQYSLYNVFKTITSQSFLNDSITCILDGDDILLHRFVLKIVNATYSMKPNILATYGGLSMIDDEFNYFTSRYDEKEFSELRKNEWKIWPFRTFKSKLFYKYLSLDPNLTYMKDTNGNYFTMASDMALMFSLFEICQYSEVSFIDTPLYGYRLHDNNDHIVNRSLQFQAEEIIRNKTPLISSS